MYQQFYQFTDLNGDEVIMDLNAVVAFKKPTGYGIATDVYFAGIVDPFRVNVAPRQFLQILNDQLRDPPGEEDDWDDDLPEIDESWRNN